MARPPLLWQGTAAYRPAGSVRTLPSLRNISSPTGPPVSYVHAYRDDGRHRSGGPLDIFLSVSPDSCSGPFDSRLIRKQETRDMCRKHMMRIESLFLVFR